ncbi:hypothetical protein F5Y03DRAFT_67325 [Xylaria venustula]|nr:hypothetical protein F5Y03DRAFT_67325 [Xylaria venustula]
MFGRFLQGRSRPPRADARESHHASGRVNGYEHRLSTLEDHLHFASDDLNYQSSSLHNASWVTDTAVFPHSDDPISGTSRFQGLTMEPEWVAPAISYVDGQYGRDYYSSRLDFSEPAWEDSTVPFQHGPHGYYQESVSPITSLPEEGASEQSFESAQHQADVVSSLEPQSGRQTQTGSTSPVGTDALSIRTFRRDSTRARQGSYVRDSDADRRGIAVMHTPMDQPEVAEEQDSSDSSGGSTPIDQDQYIDRFMGDLEDPWSPENRHQTPIYQYPYRY